MGWTHVQSALEVALPTHEKMVLVVLAKHANKNNQCCPSRALIAEKTGLFPTTVSKMIRRLREEGLVSIERGPDVGQVYTLNLPSLPKKESV